VINGTIQFKDWLPDQPDLNNPGLTEALNVVPIGSTESGYQPYSPLSTSGTAMSVLSSPQCSLLAPAIGVSVPYVYVSSSRGDLWQTSATTGSFTNYGPGITQPSLALTQYNDLVIASIQLHGLYQQTVGGTSTFAAITSAPHGSVLGRINEFLITGNIEAAPNSYPHLVAWSSIANPTDWPTPGSDSALASQSGEQFLHSEHGAVTGIYGGDQWGIITQQNAITRVTYVGGSVVFQFDTLDDGIGMDLRNGGVMIGGKLYFASSRGFYATDGMSLDPIGEEKVNRWVAGKLSGWVGFGSAPFASVAVDWTNKIIYWYLGGAATSPVVMYNFETNRFTHASDSNVSMMVNANKDSFPALGLLAIGIDNKLGRFTGTPGTATFTTGETEPNPGGYAYIGGVKPLVGATANALTCAVGTRTDLNATPTYSSDVTVNSRTGFSDCRVESRYARARVKIAGTFTNAQGAQFLSHPTGQV
jgi:hypothetical protein